MQGQPFSVSLDPGLLLTTGQQAPCWRRGLRGAGSVACWRWALRFCGAAVLLCDVRLYLTISRMDHHSARAPEPVGAYPHAKRVGNLLFLSGVGPRKRGTKEIPGVTLDAEGNVVAYDIAEQCRSCFENIRAVLEDAGASWNDIVDVTTFLTDMKKDFATYNRIYAEYFAGPDKPNPTRTTIEINRLPTPIAIELKVIAAVGAQ
jgi:2-aminomuconate deaminase